MHSWRSTNQAIFSNFHHSENERTKKLAKPPQSSNIDNAWRISADYVARLCIPLERITVLSPYCTLIEL